MTDRQPRCRSPTGWGRSNLHSFSSRTAAWGFVYEKSEIKWVINPKSNEQRGICPERLKIMTYSWSERVLALHKSKFYKGTYRMILGEYTVDSARRAGAEYYLKEDTSGVFALGRTSSGLPVNARHMRIFCPWHETSGHLLQAIDSKTLICTQCDPRLEK